jgi:hypothetical protein
MTQPLPVLPLEYAPPPAAGRRPTWRRIGRVGAAAGWLTCLVAWALVLLGLVESVLVTGPIIFTLGLLTLLGGAFNRERWPLILGVSHCAICVLFLFLVNAFHWSPRDAKLPFTVIGGVYTFLLSPVPTLFTIGRHVEPLPRRSAELP